MQNRNQQENSSSWFNSISYILNRFHQPAHQSSNADRPIINEPPQADYEDRLIAIDYPSEFIPNEYLGAISLEIVNNPVMICTGYTSLFEKDNLLQVWASSANKHKFHPIGQQPIPEHSIKTVPHIENAILAFVERQEQIYKEHPRFEALEIFKINQHLEKNIAEKVFEYNKQINLREFYIAELNILLDIDSDNSNPPKTLSAKLINSIKLLLGYSKTNDSANKQKKQSDAAIIIDLLKKVELLNFHLQHKNSPDPYIRQKQIHQLLNLSLSNDQVQEELDRLLKFNSASSTFISRRSPFEENKLYLFSASDLYEEDKGLKNLLNRIRQEANHQPTIKPGGLVPED